MMKSVTVRVIAKVFLPIFQTLCIWRNWAFRLCCCCCYY